MSRALFVREQLLFNDVLVKKELDWQSQDQSAGRQALDTT
jgi:hypothetical protein